MVLAIDTSRALRTPDEMTQLMRAIYESDASVDDEAHWVEWKGSLPLDKAAGQFPIAKAIIGFANRDPERAKTACEGVAYMVVGVKPGSVDGVTPIDGATFDQGIRKYVAGPRFDARYMKFEGADVLMVIVEAPDYGHPIHTLQKPYEKFCAGTIFHRGAAQSEPAGPREVAMLGERLVKGTRSPDLAIKMTAESEPLMRLALDRAEVQEWLDARQEYVRANSGAKPEKPKPPRNPSPTSFGQGALSPMMTVGAGALFDHLYAKPDDAQKFDQAVAKHLDECERRMADILVRAIVESDENGVTLSVFNDTDDPVTQVSVTAHVPNAGLMVYVSPPKAPPFPVIPKWPSPIDEFREYALRNRAALTAEDLDFGSMVASVTEYDDFFEISWTVGNVLARDSAELDVTIVPGPAAPDEIEVDLMARSTSHRSVARSSAKLSISSNTWGPTDWWRAVPVPRD